MFFQINKEKNRIFLSVIISCNLVVSFIALFGCGGEGYRNEALQGQSKKSLNRIRNSLEQFWVEKGSYPPDRADLGNYLKLYVEDWEKFVNESFSQDPLYLTPDSLTTYYVEVKAKDSRRTPFSIRNQRETPAARIDTLEGGK